MEEVKRRANNNRDVVSLKERGVYLYTSSSVEITTLIKKHFHRRKRLWREESKKEYTGDALALRGDEGRDKLR